MVTLQSTFLGAHTCIVKALSSGTDTNTGSVRLCGWNVPENRIDHITYPGKSVCVCVCWAGSLALSSQRMSSRGASISSRLFCSTPSSPVQNTGHQHGSCTPTSPARFHISNTFASAADQQRVMPSSASPRNRCKYISTPTHTRQGLVCCRGFRMAAHCGVEGLFVF